MRLFKKKQTERTPMTAEEAFFASQLGFDVDAVNKYQQDAPSRELYKVVEDIKGAIQRRADYNISEWDGDIVVVFVATPIEVARFFRVKGFNVDMETENIGDKLSMHIKVTW